MIERIRQRLAAIEQQPTATDGSCITLLVPASFSNERFSTFLTQEQSTAQNIKDKSNRKSVQTALGQIRS